MKKEVIDFRNASSDTWSRVVWQKLFNVYRESDCDMEYMIAMLVDYDHIRKAVEKSLDGSDVTFLWGCDPKCWMTLYREPHDVYGSQYSVRQVLDMRGYEIGVLCKISQDKAELEYFFPEK